jgi:hypothetical protein
MAKSILSLLSWIALFDAAFADPVPDPLVTPGPLLVRQNNNPDFVGYYASDVIGGTTECK